MDNMNLNQFGIGQIRGQVDFNIAKRGTMTVKVDASQATNLYPGDSVIIYSGGTGPMPTVVKAADSDTVVFYVVRGLDRSDLSAGAIIEVMGAMGPVVWLKADAAINAGALVEDVSADGSVQTKSGNKTRGISLLAAASGALTPIMIITPCAVAS